MNVLLIINSDKYFVITENMYNSAISCMEIVIFNVSNQSKLSINQKNILHLN